MEGQSALDTADRRNSMWHCLGHDAFSRGTSDYWVCCRVIYLAKIIKLVQKRGRKYSAESQSYNEIGTLNLERTAVY